MEIRKSKDGILLSVKVNPSSGRFGLHVEAGRVLIDLKGKPEKGRANLELVAGLRKIFGRDVFVVKGHKGRDKVILVKNLSEEELKKIIESR